MKVKRFEARDTQTALAMVKDELGKDAVILSTRTLRGNRQGRSGRPLVELVAAVDFDADAYTLPTAIKQSPMNREKDEMRYGYHAYQEEQPTSFTDAGDERRIPAPGPAGRPTATAEPPCSVSLEAQDLQRRFADLLRVHNIDLPAEEQVLAAPRQQTPPRPSAPRPEEVAQWRQQIIEQLQTRPLCIRNHAGPTVIALVGPTGVGKTTTAAKIAAWYSIHERSRVALLSMDCYRIGATDQLRTYARIMRLPCEIALRQQDLAAALARHRDKDLIIIDTAGKSPFDLGHIKELQSWFAPHQHIEPYLVVSATAKKEDLHHIIETYRPLKTAGLMLTKLDETRAYATLCQQVAAAALPISCICTGQKVPEDFMLASKDFLRALFGKGWNTAMMKREALAGQSAWLQ